MLPNWECLPISMLLNKKKTFISEKNSLTSFEFPQTKKNSQTFPDVVGTLSKRISKTFKAVSNINFAKRENFFSKKSFHSAEVIDLKNLELKFQHI